jgi:hypothetical protein
VAAEVPARYGVGGVETPLAAVSDRAGHTDFGAIRWFGSYSITSRSIGKRIPSVRDVCRKRLPAPTGPRISASTVTTRPAHFRVWRRVSEEFEHLLGLFQRTLLRATSAAQARGRDSVAMVERHEQGAKRRALAARPEQWSGSPRPVLPPSSPPLLPTSVRRAARSRAGVPGAPRLRVGVSPRSPAAGPVGRRSCGPCPRRS